MCKFHSGPPTHRPHVAVVVLFLALVRLQRCNGLFLFDETIDVIERKTISNGACDENIMYNFNYVMISADDFRQYVQITTCKQYCDTLYIKSYLPNYNTSKKKKLNITSLLNRNPRKRYNKFNILFKYFIL